MKIGKTHIHFNRDVGNIADDDAMVEDGSCIDASAISIWKISFFIVVLNTSNHVTWLQFNCEWNRETPVFSCKHHGSSVMLSQHIRLNDGEWSKLPILFVDRKRRRKNYTQSHLLSNGRRVSLSHQRHRIGFSHWIMQHSLPLFVLFKGTMHSGDLMQSNIRVSLDSRYFAYDKKLFTQTPTLLWK